MLSYNLPKSLYTKGFQHISAPLFALLKTFFNYKQKGGEIFQKSTKMTRICHFYTYSNVKSLSGVKTVWAVMSKSSAVIASSRSKSSC